MVTLGEVTEPAYTWSHYIAAPDARDREGREFPNRAERVKAELWVSSFRTTLVNTNCMEIIEVMTGSVESICRISLDARRASRVG